MRSTFLVLFMILAITTRSQVNEKWYLTTAGEIIFSHAKVDFFGNEDGSVLRFTPFFNSQNHLNKDLNQNLGFFTGLNVRNVGFIYKYPAQTYKTKFRSYNLGVPLGIKLGNIEHTFMYAGYEIEIPFHYKEKFFDEGKKTGKYRAWFSKKQPAYYNSLMVGIQFSGGTNLKFKYYLTNFFNKDYTVDSPAGQIKPFQDFDVNVFYISLSTDMFKAAQKTKKIVKEHDLVVF